MDWPQAAETLIAPTGLVSTLVALSAYVIKQVKHAHSEIDERLGDEIEGTTARLRREIERKDATIERMGKEIERLRQRP